MGKIKRETLIEGCNDDRSFLIAIIIVIIMAVALIVFYYVVPSTDVIKEPKTDLIDMNCFQLEEELRNKNYEVYSINELYHGNVLRIMELKDCKIGGLS